MTYISCFSDFAFYFYYYFMENCHTWIIISMWQNDLHTNTSRSVWPILYGLMIKMLQYKMYPAGELRCPTTALVLMRVYCILIAPQKHTLWVLFRSASQRHFLWVPKSYVFCGEKKNITTFCLKIKCLCWSFSAPHHFVTLYICESSEGICEGIWVRVAFSQLIL